MSKKLQLDFYSHGVRVSGYSRELFARLNYFFERLTLKETNTNRFGQVEVDVRKRYFGLRKDRKCFYIHRHSWPMLEAALKNLGIDPERLTKVHHTIPESAALETAMNDKYTPREHQIPIIASLADELYSRRLDLQTGKGKDQPLDAKIKIPGGWSSMGEMQVGTQVVAWDGTTSTVVGVYPQGEKALYRLTFGDGRSVEAGAEHLWQVYHGEAKDWVLATTVQLLEWLAQGIDLAIPTIQPEQQVEVALPTPPYRYGLQLARAQLAGEQEGCDPRYLHAEHYQRLLLTKGLLDPLAQVSEDGRQLVVSLPDRGFLEQLQYLVRSLGGLATLNGNEGAYQLVMEYPNLRELLHGSALLDQITLDTPSDSLRLPLVSVETSRRAEAQCISIDHPDRLYITDDFIVTHNTFSALSASNKMAKRTLVMLPPKYFGIWVTEIENLFTDIGKRVVTVSGSGEFAELVRQAKEGELAYDFILMSSVTYRMFLENYERFGDDIVDMGWGVRPYEFHALIGAGVQINDEIQEDPGLVFRIDIFTNVAKQIYLSATPYTGDKFVTDMIDVMLPEATKCPLPEIDVYAHVIDLLYSDAEIQRKDYLSPYKSAYSHARYETRMLKAKRRRERYFAMVERVARKVFVESRKPGQKLLVLCSTVNFIKVLTEHLAKAFPDLVVRKRISGSSYGELLENDITVSTIKSSGTGVDIPNLREVILLQATGSRKDSIQILGRLRRLKDFPEVSPRLTYLTCMNIPQHQRYARSKKEFFHNRVLSHRVMRI